MGSCSGPSRTSRDARLEENLGADNFRTQSVAAKLVQLYSDWRKQDGARRFRTEGR